MKPFNFILLIAIIGCSAFLYFKSNGFINDFTKDQVISVGKITISDIIPTNQIKVLSMYKEIIVGNKKSSRDQKLYTIYPGEIDFGFDFKECDLDNIISQSNNNLIVSLPEITWLNKESFIDEINRRTAIENGEWSEDEREKQKDEAELLILRSCEIDDCWNKAEEQAKKILTELLSKLGYNNIEIDIPHRYNDFRYVNKDINSKEGNDFTFVIDDNYNGISLKDNRNIIFIGSKHIDFRQEIKQEIIIMDYCNYCRNNCDVIIDNNEEYTELIYHYSNIETDTERNNKYNELKKVNEKETYNLLHDLFGDEKEVFIHAVDRNWENIIVYNEE